ncbi:MAG: hypothetical protein P8O89_05230 [Polaribacter sp.]|nr:hypothetical protein [Polaribacter sp.]
MTKKIQIVSFDIPYPPKYGGVIDIYYKIEALKKQGIKIYLHTFLYDNNIQQQKLESLCDKVFYYNRSKNFKFFFSLIPFIILSRKNRKLYENINSIDAPILFEGLHTCYFLKKDNFKVKTFVRTHNIEHKYYYGLAKSEKNIIRKCFFFLESKKLKKFEKNLSKVNGIFTISPFEQNYFSKHYKKSHYIPAFHESLKIQNNRKQGDFILYHGDLRISDNIKAALFLINVYKNTPYKLVISSNAKVKRISDEIKKYDNIFLQEIPTKEDLDILFDKAHINTLISFQKTGIKLKLLNTLYKGKHIIANSEMIEDTGLEDLCNLANSKNEILKKTAELFNEKFSNVEVQKRSKKLESFNPIKSAEKIIDVIFT